MTVLQRSQSSRLGTDIKSEGEAATEDLNKEHRDTILPHLPGPTFHSTGALSLLLGTTLTKEPTHIFSAAIEKFLPTPKA